MRARCTMLSPARKMRGIRRGWRRAVDGNVAVEFGFIVPILVMLALGTFDFGRLGLEKITLSSAARAGAQYGMQDFVTAADTAGMVQAARNDAGDTGSSLTVTARQFCLCTADGEVACTAPCSDSGFPMMYVDVTVQDNVQLLFDYPGLSQTQTLVSNSRMRVR